MVLPKPSPLPEDAELVSAVAFGGPSGQAAEKVFCGRWGARVHRYAQRHLRDPQVAPDVAQQVLLVVIEAMRKGHISQPERLGSFVLSTCRHLVWDENRAESRRARARARAELEPAEGLVQVTLDVIDRLRLEMCVRGLPAREQSVILLSYCEDWSAEKIAESLGTSAGNVRVLRHRALARLTTCLETGAGGTA